MRKCTIAVIGAGSTYTPELMNGFLRRKAVLPVDSFRFCDTDPVRGEILAGMARRMLQREGMRTPVFFFTDVSQAVAGADYVITQIRVGKMAARILDERIPLRHGLLGQETTGLGGLACGLRTVPVIAQIAQTVKENAAPGAWLINFSNPSGLVAEAVLGQQPDTRLIGLCNIPVKLERDAAALLGMNHADCEFVGLNHLCWLTEVFRDGVGCLDALLSMPLSKSGLNNIPDMKYTPEQLRAIGGFPCGYLNYYYFPQEMVKTYQNEEKTRGEKCLELEQRLLKLYADPQVDTAPELLASRGGAMYSEAAVSLIESIETDSGHVHVVNVQNRGVLPMLKPPDVAELRCRVSKDGAEPLPMRKVPGDHICGMMQSVKAYEHLAAKAALEGSYQSALSAAVTHPLSGDYLQTKQVLDALLWAHKAYLPRFHAYFQTREEAQ